jgi:hypothetical protein
MFSQDHLHIIGDDSGCGHLIYAGVKRKNIVCLRPLANMMGPIGNQLAPERQFHWLEEHAPGVWGFLGLTASDVALCQAGNLVRLDTIKHWEGPKTLWYSSKNVGECSFFMAFVSAQQKLENFTFIDVARGGFISTSEYPVESVKACWDSRYCLDENQVADVKYCAKQLDGADIELLHLHADGEIASVPIPYFDAFIMGHMHEDWGEMKEVVQSIFDAEYAVGRRSLQYVFLLWRLEQLRMAGKIERGEQTMQPIYKNDPSRGEVRLCR